MARHPFSRRSHRRKRTGGLRGSRFSTNPFAEFGDGWIKIKPRYQKIIGKRVVRVSSGRRIDRFKLQDPQGVITLRRRSDVDPEREKRIQEIYDERLRFRPQSITPQSTAPSVGAASTAPMSTARAASSSTSFEGAP